ncbi:ureohydrolase [Grosmannia clavigera kw1407]|uniref:Ureohydrolase n=1 Tax=Grosmannia clavigera (strain kw1407 / UAMH 11150) TaxID=655863 RepID=F0XH03_GROCL|nr:ureohydrolase [Grosmannia clavigera kw1407]EFX02628.1 ureohydrolase [Grosmannia clavigera kw1407]
MKSSNIGSWLLAGLALAGVDACGHHHHQDAPLYTEEQLAELERKWGQDWTFTGIGSYAHLDYVKCLTTPSELYDIAIIGAPFDTAVSYRPGARFGPRAIRQASSRQSAMRGFNHRAGVNPYLSWARILDCGDIPVTPIDNAVALAQMTEAFTELGSRAPASPSVLARPRLITLGGDHSLALPALRALRTIYGKPLRVIHFDAHLDTWHPSKYPSAWPSEQAQFNHGSMFWLAGREGLLSNASSAPSVHAGLRTRLTGADYADYTEDDDQNWVRLIADDLDDMGVKGVLQSILDHIGNTDDPVYLSVDIDVLDPAFAPGTGTPEPGGWTTRELIRILRGLEGLNIVGADIVEVSPAYQGAGEETALAAAQVVYEFITSMVKRGMAEMGKEAVEEDLAFVDQHAVKEL